MIREEFLYVCDGNVPGCTKENCRWVGVEVGCSHTTDQTHALYGEPRKFAVTRTPDDRLIYYEELRDDGRERIPCK